MTDLITAEEAGKLAHKYRFANNDLERVLCETARTVIALHAQLADAEAAQAAVVEKVAKLVHDICKTDAHACRGTSPEMSRDRDEYAEDLPIAIRDLASASGVETLTKLRARAEKAEQERAAEWNRRRDADGSRDAARAACDTLRIERDRLAAANAVLEAKVAGLREAVDEQTKARAQHWLRRTMTAPEDAEVEALCERCGYGAVMDAASRLWARKPHGSGAFYIGGCIGFKSDEEARAALATQEAGTC